MDNSEWLANLKAGDEVLVCSSSPFRPDTIATVDKVTKTQIVTGHMRFRRDYGRQVGESSWGWASIRELTPERRTKILHDNRVNVLAGRFEEIKWRAVPLEKLEAIHALLEVNANARGAGTSAIG